MLAKRIIPCLDVKDGLVVKGIKFLDLKEAGDPVKVALCHDPLLVPNAQAGPASIDHPDLLVWVVVHGNGAPGQRGVQGHHHPLTAQASEDRGLQPRHLRQRGGIVGVDEVAARLVGQSLALLPPGRCAGCIGSSHSHDGVAAPAAATSPPPDTPLPQGCAIHPGAVARQSRASGPSPGWGLTCIGSGRRT